MQVPHCNRQFYCFIVWFYNVQEATALSVATALKDMITPYMLRRVKSDVKKMISLPNKSEQVLFCSLTDEQRDLYKGFLLVKKKVCCIL